MRHHRFELPAFFPATRALVGILGVGTMVCAVSCKKPAAGGADGGDDGAAASAAALTLAFLNGFEGEIDGFIKENKPGAQQTPIAVMIKSAKVRFELPEALTKGVAANPLGDKGYVILDSTAKKLYAVSDAKKEAIELDLNTTGKALQGMHPPPGGPHGGAPQAPPTKVTKTGKTDTVAGYTCEYWDIASDHKEGTVCMGSDGPSWLSIPMTGIPTEQAWMLDLLDGKHFPLRFIGYGKDGTTEESRIEVTKIDKKSLQDSEFQVPAGYKTIDLEKMMSGFGMPGGIPGGLPIPPHPPPHH
jgi:hypothetical protein